MHSPYYRLTVYAPDGRNVLSTVFKDYESYLLFATRVVPLIVKDFGISKTVLQYPGEQSNEDNQ